MSAADRLVAIEEIRQLKARYFRYIDQKDWESWRALFAADFVAEGQVVGPDGMIKHIQENGLYDRVGTVFHGHMPEIDILSPTTARGIWAADFRLYYPPGQPYPTTGKEAVLLGKSSHTYAHYYETYVKVDGNWKLQSMDIKLRRIDDLGGITISPLHA